MIEIRKAPNPRLHLLHDSPPPQPSPSRGEGEGGGEKANLYVKEGKET